MTPSAHPAVGYQCLHCGNYRHETPTGPCHGADGTDRADHAWGEPLECIEGGGIPSRCQGPVEMRFGYGLKGSYARCLGHFDDYMERAQITQERYPDSPNPPADFDPTYAGEHWDEDY